MSAVAKRWLALVAVLAAASIVVVVLVLWMNGPQRQRHRFQQIPVGTSKADVIAVMGGGSDVVFLDTEPGFFCRSHAWWQRRPTYFIFVLDADDTVVSKWDPDKPE